MGSAFTLLEYVEMDVFLLKKKIRTVIDSDPKKLQ